jgi:hypothetical protein
MERSEYLKRCQRVSCIKGKIPRELLVGYKHSTYIPKAYQLSYSEGRVVHTAILEDLNCNSLTYCLLDRVSECD